MDERYKKKSITHKETLKAKGLKVDRNLNEDEVKFLETYADNKNLTTLSVTLGVPMHTIKRYVAALRERPKPHVRARKYSFRVDIMQKGKILYMVFIEAKEHVQRVIKRYGNQYQYIVKPLDK